MVNTDEFIKRLEIILDYYSLTASSFADKINVQRSSLSHLLSGRNKPSLDFILKIIEVFPEVDLYWILNGKGNFPKNTDSEKRQHLETPVFTAENKSDLFSNSGESQNNNKNEEFSSESLFRNTNESIIEKIVVLYKDGTFSEFKPR